MPKVILYIAHSLDGYIATKDGSISWLDSYNTIDYGYNQFLKSIDIIVMGSKTYEQVLSFGNYPYKDKISYIHTKRTMNKPLNADITFIPTFSKKLYEDLDPNKTVCVVGGAHIIQTFIQHNLITDYQIFTMPVILGSGIPLFLETKPQRLIAQTSQQYKNGVILTTYTVHQ